MAWSTRLNGDDFPGYVTGFDPAELSDRDALRDELGWGPDERICVVTVGGSGVGGALLRRVIAARPAWRCTPTSRGSTDTSRPATWPSSRAA